MYLTDKEIGNLIKKRRTELGLTQTELGKHLGVGAAAVNKWEQGTVTNIKREILRNISLTLRIHPAYLIGINPDEFSISLTAFDKKEVNEITEFCKYLIHKRGDNHESR